MDEEFYCRRFIPSDSLAYTNGITNQFKFNAVEEWKATVCQSYIKSTYRKAGEAAKIRGHIRSLKYASLSDNIFFGRIATETGGPWVDEGRKLMDENSNISKSLPV